MKTQKFLRIIFINLTILLVCACSSDEIDPTPDNPPVPVVQPYLRLSNENYDIDGKKQAISVSVETNIDGLTMTFYKKEPWVSLADIKKYKDSEVYLFNIEENKDDTTRVELVIFRAGRQAKAATIIQKPLEK